MSSKRNKKPPVPPPNAPATASGPRPVRRASGNRRLSGGIIALGSAAVVAIYAAGRAHTGSAFDSLTSGAPLEAVAPPSPTALTTVSGNTPLAGARATVTVPAVPSAGVITPSAGATAPVRAASPTPFAPAGAAPTATAASPTGAYKDGTYTGSGTSRHGGMTVTVEIKGGQIASANVTACKTRYPCSYVAPLARAAVTQQGVPSGHISGATDSSRAYLQALASALKDAAA